MMKPYFYLYLTLLFRQLDNSDANIDENDIDIFPVQTNIVHIKYHKENNHKENNFYTMGRSELKIIDSYQLSALILLLFISAAVGYFAQRSYLEWWQQFSKWSFDFQNF